MILTYLPVLVSAFIRGGLTTSRTEALQAQRFCTNSLKVFTQSFLHRARPKTRGPEIGSRSALTVVDDKLPKFDKEGRALTERLLNAGAGGIQG